jgi:hypothetical protein
MENAGTTIVSRDTKQSKRSDFMDLPRGCGWYVVDIGFSMSFGTVSATVGRAGLATRFPSLLQTSLEPLRLNQGSVANAPAKARIANTSEIGTKALAETQSYSPL